MEDNYGDSNILILSNLGLLPKKKMSTGGSGSDSEMSSVTRQMMNAPPPIPLIVLFSKASTKTTSRNLSSRRPSLEFHSSTCGNSLWKTIIGHNAEDLQYEI